jgi:hypothetical protein
MSGPIRKIIGPTIGYLRGRMAIGSELLVAQLKDAELIISLRKE